MDLNLIEMEDFECKQMDLILIKMNTKVWEITACQQQIQKQGKCFLTEPIACELTGFAFSEDYTTMFVGIQHPGESLKGSTFPYGKTPRSSVMMIRKLDGGVIGS